ncbi:hypothetical protein V5O48_016297 [Marasmius crinis-equi]|uniref:Protein kinase domain-containing protein n=1 Tax=Marasmius crinis-equi TaxID=585013 RepID=A0ABR3ESF6_9AGAR
MYRDTDELRRPLLTTVDDEERLDSATHQRDTQDHDFNDQRLSALSPDQQTIDELDKAIQNETGPCLEKLLKLSKLCENYRRLPSSCAMPERSNLVLQDEPFARGGFADVYRGFISGIGRVAVKRIRGREDQAGLAAVDYLHRIVFREAVVWKHCHHRNITPFLYAFDEPPALCLVSVWMANGNVVSYLRDRPHADIKPLILNIVAGCQYLHNMGIVHGDLKGANILVNEAYEACLSDFGMANAQHDTSNATAGPVAGSARWLAPELIFSYATKPTFASDMYSFGIVLWEILTCRVPYEHLASDQSVLLHVSRGLRPCVQCISLSPAQVGGLLAVMEDAWAVSPQQRPRFDDDLPRLLLQASSPQKRINIVWTDRVILLLSPLFGALASCLLKLSLWAFFFSTMALRYAILHSYSLATYSSTRGPSPVGSANTYLVTPFHIGGIFIASICLGVGSYLRFATIPENWAADEEVAVFHRGSVVLLHIVVGLCSFASAYHSIHLLVALIRVKWLHAKRTCEEQPTYRTQLYVSNVASTITSNEVRSVFEASGEIEWISRHYPHNHCIIQYCDERDAERILSSGDFLTTLRVSRRHAPQLQAEASDQPPVAESYWGWLWNLHMILVNVNPSLP